MATARKAKKPIIHFGVKGQKKCVSVLCCFLLHIDLFTHSADMMAQGPSSHLYSHSTHGALMFPSGIGTPAVGLRGWGGMIASLLRVCLTRTYLFPVSVGCVVFFVCVLSCLVLL